MIRTLIALPCCWLIFAAASPVVRGQEPAPPPANEASATEEKKETPAPEKPAEPTDPKIETKGEEKTEPDPSAEKPVEPKKDPETIRKLPSFGSVTNPILPGQPWRIHDLFRPHPPRIQAASQIDQPPSDAIVLFDGKDLSQWYHRGASAEELFAPQWKVVDGYFEITPHSGSLYTLEGFGSCQLHLEWASPGEPKGDGQGRGNSGVKLMELFEIQILDSHENRTYADGQAGSMYGQYPPLVNVARAPGEWQTYDIFFEAPLFEGDKLIRPAFATVVHNGVLVHHHRQFAGPTGARAPVYRPIAPAAPLMLQDHGNPGRFRNIWIRNLTP